MIILISGGLCDKYILIKLKKIISLTNVEKIKLILLKHKMSHTIEDIAPITHKVTDILVVISNLSCRD